MPQSRCAKCGREEFLPFRCKLCGQPHCLDHRLPENHGCAGLENYRGRPRDERIGRQPGDKPQLKVRRPLPGAEAFHRVARFSRRSATHLLLATILIVFVLQILGSLALSGATGADLGPAWATLGCALALGECGAFTGAPFGLAAKPWSVLTNLFAHDNVLHIFFNALFLYFFGTELESRLGRKSFLSLFFVGGILAAFAQVAVFQELFGVGGAVLGASGGTMAILGTLTVLAPTMRVIIFIVPAPLWALTLLFVVLDFAGFFGPRAGIANLAHLMGLATGLTYGLHLRRRGVLPRKASTWASQRRF